MTSKLHASSRWPDAFEERLGPTRLTFAPEVDGAGLRWRTREVRVLGLPLPAHWFDGIEARCGERSSRYAFDIAVRLPVIGLLVAYSGWLDVVADE